VCCQKWVKRSRYRLKPWVVDYRLRINLSVHSSLAQGSVRRTLSLAGTDFRASSEDRTDNVTKIVVSVVVTSLHAAILHSSEALRAEHPGLERYVPPPHHNLFTPTQFGTILDSRLQPSRTARNGSRLAFVCYRLNRATPLQSMTWGASPSFQHQEQKEAKQWSYKVHSCTSYRRINVDRLEPTFKITPLSHSIPPRINVIEPNGWAECRASTSSEAYL
jgi:hypothetical protein